MIGFRRATTPGSGGRCHRRRLCLPDRADPGGDVLEGYDADVHDRPTESGEDRERLCSPKQVIKLIQQNGAERPPRLFTITSSRHSSAGQGRWPQPSCWPFPRAHRAAPVKRLSPRACSFPSSSPCRILLQTYVSPPCRRMFIARTGSSLTQTPPRSRSPQRSLATPSGRPRPVVL